MKTQQGYVIVVTISPSRTLHRSGPTHLSHQLRGGDAAMLTNQAYTRDQPALAFTRTEREQLEGNR